MKGLKYTHTRNILLECFSNKLIYTIPIYDEMDILQMYHCNRLYINPTLSYLEIKYVNKKTKALLDAETCNEETCNEEKYIQSKQLR